MAVHFIKGRAGSGKTHFCLSSVAEHIRSGRPEQAFLLVPEQTTFTAEKALCTAFGLGGIMGVEVLSFQRMAHRRLKEVGGARSVNVSSVGRDMLLRRIIAQNAENLRAFSGTAARRGFVRFAGDTISELRKCGVTPEMLALQVEKFGWDKLSDLSLIYSQYSQYISDKYIEPDELLDILHARMPLSAMLSNAKIWIDGFSGFTPQQLKVLQRIFMQCPEVYVTLCYDAKSAAQGEMRELFARTGETLRQLELLAQEGAVPVCHCVIKNGLIEGCNGARNASCPGRVSVTGEAGEADAVGIGGATGAGTKEAHGGSRFGGVAALQVLERSLFNHSSPQYDGVATEVCIMPALNPYEEVEAVAIEITRLCRDEGLRWRDICILLKDGAAYNDMISDVFGRYDIPFFADAKRSIMHFPVVELVRSALEVVVRDWSYEAVFRYLKTDMAFGDREAVDKLENYVLCFGIHGRRRWGAEEDWGYRRALSVGEEQPEDETTQLELRNINVWRREVFAPLDAMQRKLMDAKDIRAQAEALFELLVALDVPQKLNAAANDAHAQGKPEQAQQIMQLWDAIMDILDEVVEVLGDVHMDVRDFAEVLESGFEKYELGLIPPGLDQIIISSIERSRNPNCRVSFVLNVNEGVLPGRVDEEGFFTDFERNELDKNGLKLGPDSRERSMSEIYNVYIAMTRSCERLYLSFPMADNSGRALRPSSMIGRVRWLLPQLKVLRIPVSGTGNVPEIEAVTQIRSTLPHLIRRLKDAVNGGSIDPVWLDAYSAMMMNESWKKDYGSFVQAICQKNVEKPLKSETALGLYGQPLRSSVYKIEKFRQCPFSFFMTYGMRLRERPVYTLGMPDMGQFYHRALYLFYKQVLSEGMSLRNIDRQRSHRMLAEITDGLVPQLQNEILSSSARYRHLTRTLKRVLNRSVDMLLSQASKDRGSIHRMEVAFGGVGGSDGQGEDCGYTPPVVVMLDEGLRLELAGRIDRVDQVRVEQGENAGTDYIRIIDYKTGGKEIDLNDIYHGLNLQLLTYMHAMLGKGKVPGAMLYFRMDDPILKSNTPMSEEEARQELEKCFRMTGFVLADADFIKMTDESIGKKSNIIPVEYKADGSFSAHSSTLTPQQFAALESHLLKLLRETGLDMLSGRVDIRPVKSRGKTACDYCEYFSVCRFDVLGDENRYKILPKYSKDELWERMGTEAEQ